GTGSFVDDGFLAGDTLTVSGTTSHDGIYTVAAVSNSELTLTTTLPGSDGETSVPGTRLSASSFGFSISNANVFAQAQLGLGTPGASTADLADLVIVTDAGLNLLPQPQKEFRVTLDGLLALGRPPELADLKAAIEAGTQNTVTVVIEDSRLLLVQKGTLTGNPRLAFEVSGGVSTITRDDGVAWDAAGQDFAVGDFVRVLGSTSNDGIAEITGITGSVLTVAGTLTPEEGRGIAVTIVDPASPERFRVESVNGSPSALKLGILHFDAEDDVDGDGDVDAADGDGVIEGDEIGGKTLLDRFFIENAEVTGTLSLATPPAPGGVTVTADFGIVEVDLTGEGSFLGEVRIGLDDPGTQQADGRTTLTELLDGLSDPASLVTGPEVSGAQVEETLSFQGAAETITRDGGASWEDAGFAVGQRITVSGTAANDGVYTIQSLAGNTLEVAEDLQQELAVAGAEVTQAMGRFALTASVRELGGLSLQIPDPSVGITLFDFGDPFASTPPSLDLDLPDLGDLLDLSNLSFSDILAGLRFLSDFLGQFEAFGFLSDPIPIIDLSFNDLLSFAERFDRAVQDAEDDPGGALQDLEARLGRQRPGRQDRRPGDRAGAR
ncbi:MAG: hypothetical protein R3190_17485, partial [Thermoanaerobaculia bacterium]|nr:hypothetical protein [Thermoanaerobaculia bacterium]